MITAGIIAEYNPFHNGHKYHMEETRRQTGADYIVAAISGDFVQRGAPALINKYHRAQMALASGADMVLELPVTAALSSAEGFASGGVCLFDGLGVVDVLSFGCETWDQPQLFEKTALTLVREPKEYKSHLSEKLKSGMSFPKARELAMQHVIPGSGVFLSRPNNILGLEYQKAILRHNCRLKICPIPRLGNEYHTTALTGDMSSATAIRKELFSAHGPFSELESQVPPVTFELLKEAKNSNRFLCENDFSNLLYYALLRYRDHLTEFGPSNDNLVSRIQKLLEGFENWEQFAALLKSKNQTYTGINRCLTQIMLHITRDDFKLAARYGYAPYARILGFQKTAAPLLKKISEQSSIPVLMQIAGDRNSLNDSQNHLLNLDLAAADLYNYIQFSKSGIKTKSDFRHPLVIL